MFCLPAGGNREGSACCFAAEQCHALEKLSGMATRVAWAPVLAALALLQVGACLDNGLGRTPPMGYNTWNCFGTDSEAAFCALVSTDYRCRITLTGTKR